jgi:hypothetical protein
MKRLLAFVAILSACGVAEKAPVTDDLTTLSVEGEGDKNDSLSGQLKVAGSLSYGGAGSVLYSSTPRYRGVTFAGKSGDKVDIWVSSTAGDSVAWLTDSAFNTLTYNDDASTSTLDSHLTFTLGASGTFYIVFRDYNLGSHYFTVSLAGTSAIPAVCGATASCPAGYSCIKTKCYAQCGGATHKTCAAPQQCVVDPTGSCDPASDASCLGVCGTDCQALGCGGAKKCASCWGSYICIANGSTC